VSVFVTTTVARPTEVLYQPRQDCRDSRAAGQTLPELPPSGILGLDDAKALPGARLIDGWGVLPGPDPSVFAYVKTTVHGNLFRIPLRDN